jgi:hypothetical protein
MLNSSIVTCLELRVRIMYVIVLSLEAMFTVEVDDFEELKMQHSLLCSI